MYVCTRALCTRTLCTCVKYMSSRPLICYGIRVSYFEAVMSIDSINPAVTIVLCMHVVDFMYYTCTCISGTATCSLVCMWIDG